MMSSSLLHIVACLLALALTLTCCNALPRLCDELSAGGYTYDLNSLGTITSNTLFSIEGYFGASINFCGAADFCGEGVSACLFSETVATLPVCFGEPTGSFLDSNSPQLGATFLCSYTTIMPPRTVTLRGFVGSVKHSVMNNRRRSRGQ
jgi:hypothetical protein